ncbi:3-deoxy-manno-octulosonate cytidylyltransferase [Chryseolinea sp. T2]|uniref:3-deoxy-manno-octulosonate cytidylyltransferase n=1 Tax=Chryseolinea sp. T2 TaxID=3129255 RepID=UPI003077F162
MKILGIIPSRYASTRLPAKPLVMIKGKSMVQRVYEQTSKSKLLSKVVVATDHQEIFDHVKSFGGEVCMTRADHASGTDRCYEALTLQAEPYDYVINVQGDEPFIQPEQIDLLAAALDGKTEIATLVKTIDSLDELVNPSEAKVVVNTRGEAMYFSRSMIPFINKAPQEQWLERHTFFKHVGMYAYRCDILKEVSGLAVSLLEKAESLEQLRWLENGFRVTVVETQTETFAIDTPADLDKAAQMIDHH